MSASEEHLKKVVYFLEEYRPLLDSHLVDFITNNLWNKCLPELLRDELQTVDTDLVANGNWRNWNGEDPKTPELNKFFKAIDSLSLERCNFVYNARDLPDIFSSWGFQIENLDSKHNTDRHEFMNHKKSHEVEILAKVISSLAKFHSSVVIDAGAGKGYLSEFISQKYRIPVLAIDSSDITHKGALRRQNIIRKKDNQCPPLVHHVVQRIEDSTDFLKLVETHFPGRSLNGSLTITGLHTCGSLGQSVIKAFLETDCIRSLCVVTCCYHLAETSISGRLHFSKNAKMLAQQCVERTHEKKHCLSPTLHYRAVLQVLLHSLGLYNVRIGRGAPLDNFVTYAKWALEKIGLDSNKIPQDSVLEELYRSHDNYKPKMEVFQNLRIRLGSIIESAILLDRVMYLEASKVCSNYALVRLFDPMISPRCYGIIALK